MAKKARIWTPNGKSVNANEVYSKIPFFCDTEGCDAPMSIVSIGEDSAHFRSKSICDHKFSICVRNDIEFDTDKYDKSLFIFSDFKHRLLNGLKMANIHKVSGYGGHVGTGSRIAPDTLKTIYEAYVESLRSGNDNFGDCKFSDFMRCKENYTDFISNPHGFYLVEASYYHKVKDEYAILFNIPMFNPKIQSSHVKVNFLNINDFWRVYNHHKKLKKAFLCIMLIAAEWTPVVGNPDYIAECTLTKSNQHTYISLS